MVEAPAISEVLLATCSINGSSGNFFTTLGYATGPGPYRYKSYTCASALLATMLYAQHQCPALDQKARLNPLLLLGGAAVLGVIVVAWPYSS